MIGFNACVTYPGTFQPSWFSSCKLWLRADRGVTISTGVSQWNDLTANNNNMTQVTGSKQPGRNLSGAPNGLSTLTFNASQYMTLSSAVLSASPWTIVTMQKMASTAAQISSIYIGDANNGDGFGFTPLSVRVILYSGVSNLVGNTATTNWEGWTATNSGSLTTLRVSGTNVTISHSTDQPITPSSLTIVGADTSTGVSAWNGSIAEIMLFNVVLTSNQITEVENYLKAIYGVA